MIESNIGALFDLDGVLIDSESKYTLFWDKIDKLFPTGVPNFPLLIKGSNMNAILNSYFKPEVHQQIVDMLNDFQHNMRYDYFEGAMEFVQDLDENDIPCCVVTSSDQAKMDALYEQHPDFKQHFNAIITGDMVRHAKPNPECFLLGANEICVPIERCFVFEDSKNGIEAGNAAGAHVIALATTLSHDILNKKANKVIDNFIGFTATDLQL